MFASDLRILITVSITVNDYWPHPFHSYEQSQHQTAFSIECDWFSTKPLLLLDQIQSAMTQVKKKHTGVGHQWFGLSL
jgi:hypothetical protein